MEAVARTEDSGRVRGGKGGNDVLISSGANASGRKVRKRSRRVRECAGAEGMVDGLGSSEEGTGAKGASGFAGDRNGA